MSSFDCQYINNGKRCAFHQSVYDSRNLERPSCTVVKEEIPFPQMHEILQSLTVHLEVMRPMMRWGAGPQKKSGKSGASGAVLLKHDYRIGRNAPLVGMSGRNTHSRFKGALDVGSQKQAQIRKSEVGPSILRPNLTAPIPREGVREFVMVEQARSDGQRRRHGKKKVLFQLDRLGFQKNQVVSDKCRLGAQTNSTRKHWQTPF